MALVLKDRVKQAAAAPGTGTITLGATSAGFQSFAAVGNGNTTYFAVVDPASGDWEVNYGVYTSSGTTLTRNATPLSSSAGGALINFTGAVDVFLTYPSEKAVWQDISGLVAQQSFGAITATSAALTTGTITTAPVSNTDIVNKQYADAIASGIHFHEAVNLATTSALPANTYNNGTSGVGATLTGNANGALSVDSTLTTASERILVKNEAAGANNGVYTVTQVGSAGTPYILTRATDFDSVGTGVNEIDEGDFFLVTSGTANVNTAWVQQTPPPITIGTTALVFQQFSAPITYTAGTGLSESPTYTFNIANTGTAGTYGSASAVPVFVTNAQGQVTSVTNTAIAINGSAVSGNISGSAGSVANALTLGTYLTGGTYNGSAAVTATVDATSANTASKVVARDASGNFSAGTITATFSGNTTSATNIAGGAANQIPYQTGSGATSFITAASGTNTVLNFNGSAFTWSTGTISGVPLGSNLNSLTAGTYLTGTAYNGSAAQTWTVDATSANTASKVVARDASGNFSAGTITAALTGNATTATTATNQSGGTVNATAISLTTANGYINSNRTSSGSGEIGYTWSSAGVITWYNYLVTNATTLTWYSSASGTVMTLTPGGALNTIGAITQNGSQVLTAANYNSYAPTLTGTGASGTWGINITGSAGSAGSASSVPWTGVSAGARTNYDLGIQPPASGYAGFYFSKSTSSPTASDAGYILIRGSSDSFPPYTAEGITIVSDANSLNLFARGASLVAGGNAWVRMGTGSSETFRLMSDYSYSLNSSRAPIFYDSDNTGYYIDPASTSDTALRMRGGALFGPNTTWGAYLAVGGNGNISTSYASVATTDGNLHLDSKSGNNTYLNYYAGSNVYFGNGAGGGIFAQVANDGSFRSPIYYDYNNTAYYGDFASTSRINTINADSLRSYTNVYIDGNYGYGVVGLYSSVRYQGVFAMGAAYVLAADGTTTGNLYGIAWSYPSAGGAAANLSSHGMLLLENGGFQGAWGGGSLRTPTDARAPIFYDYNNTGYYVDPASTSYLYEVQAVNWFRTIGVTGLYSQSYGSHFYPQNNGRYWSITGNGSTDYGGLLFKINYESTIKGYVYWDTSGFGFLHGAGGWSVRGNVSAIGGQFYGSWFSDTDLRAPIFYDYNDTGYYVNPAGTSQFSRVEANFSIEMRSSAGGGYPAFLVNQYADVSIYRANNATAYIGFSADGLAYLYNDGTNFIFSGRGLQATSFGVGTAPSGTTGEIRATNNITAYYSSDIKFKTNVRDIPNALEIAESIGGKLFDWTDEYIEEHGGEDGYFIQKEDFGVIAQDVLKVFPVAVRTRPDGSLAVDYEKLSAVAFAAVASLSTRVKSLEARI